MIILLKNSMIYVSHECDLQTMISSNFNISYEVLEKSAVDKPIFQELLKIQRGR